MSCYFYSVSQYETMGLKSQAFQKPVSPLASLKVLYSLLKKKNGLLLPSPMT